MASTATSSGGAEEEDDDDDDEEEEEMTAAAAPAATSVECRRPRNWSSADSLTVMAPRPLRVSTLKCGERDTGFAASSNSLLMDMQLFCVGFDRLSAVSLPGWERKE